MRHIIWTMTIFCLLAFAQAQAAEVILVSPAEDGHRAIILVRGKFFVGDTAPETFRNIVNEQKGHAIVFLESPGGSILIARQLYETIYRMGISTVVVKRCSSACTLVWLSGERRFIGDDALLGFHSSSDPDNAAEKIRAANRWTVKYMITRGVPKQAAEHWVSVPPTSMEWVNQRQALEHGIGAERFSKSDPAWCWENKKLLEFELGLRPAQVSETPLCSQVDSGVQGRR